MQTPAKPQKTPAVRLAPLPVNPYLHPFSFFAMILAIANQKGGVGKTTTVVNLAAAIAARKKNVLVIDLDPQANATSGLGVEPTEGVSLLGALLNQANIDDYIVGTCVERVNLIPAEVNLSGVEIEIARQEDHLHALNRVLKPIEDSHVFDYILLDCPPSLGILMTNALATADAVLIPMQCEYYAMEGLSIILQLIDRMKNFGQNPTLRAEGIIMTMYARTRLADEVVTQVRQHYSDLVYKTVVPRSVRAGEAPSFGIPLVAYAPNTPVAKAYFDLADEFLARQRRKR